MAKSDSLLFASAHLYSAWRSQQTHSFVPVYRATQPLLILQDIRQSGIDFLQRIYMNDVLDWKELKLKGIWSFINPLNFFS